MSLKKKVFAMDMYELKEIRDKSRFVFFLKLTLKENSISFDLFVDSIQMKSIYICISKMN